MVVSHEAGWRLHYDPNIALAMGQTTPEMAKAGEAALWGMYDNIKAPTLLLRGADSDILTPTTAQAMTQRGPRAKRIELPGVGHAPTLTHAEQIQPVEAFLIRHMTVHAA
jgi:pimeloyl-ACP methyl ester carboxylesterase